ncbi:hypothetical protein GCM10023083_03050 [Streptomyces phyllanthi]
MVVRGPGVVVSGTLPVVVSSGGVEGRLRAGDVRAGVLPGRRVSWRAGGCVPGRRSVLVMTLFMAIPVSVSRPSVPYQPVTSWLGILYAAGTGRCNDIGGASGRPETSPIRVTRRRGTLGGAGVYRVNRGAVSGRREGVDGNPMGDPRTYPG